LKTRNLDEVVPWSIAPTKLGMFRREKGGVVRNIKKKESELFPVLFPLLLL